VEYRLQRPPRETTPSPVTARLVTMGDRKVRMLPPSTNFDEMHRLATLSRGDQYQAPHSYTGPTILVMMLWKRFAILMLLRYGSPGVTRGRGSGSPFCHKAYMHGKHCTDVTDVATSKYVDRRGDAARAPPPETEDSPI
jgi:hypothetical protein